MVWWCGSGHRWSTKANDLSMNIFRVRNNKSTTYEEIYMYKQLLIQYTDKSIKILQICILTLQYMYQ